MATLTLRTGVYLGKVGKRTSMHTDQKWKWAGIVSVVSIVGVLLTDVVANVVAGYISDQIKGWEVPEQATAAQNNGQAGRPNGQGDGKRRRDPHAGGADVDGDLGRIRDLHLRW